MDNVVLLNGPPRSGKDTLASMLCRGAANGPWVHDKFSVELKERCHGAYKLFTPRGGPAPHDFFEGMKDVPLEHFEGRTPRQAYVEFYRAWVEPICGAAALGRWLVRRARFFLAMEEQRMPAEKRTRSVVISDAGQPEPCEVLAREWGPDRVTLVNLSREGTSWEGDSRRRFDLPGVRTVELMNPGTPEGFLGAAKQALPHLFLELPPRQALVVATEVPR